MSESPPASPSSPMGEAAEVMAMAYGRAFETYGRALSRVITRAEAPGFGLNALTTSLVELASAGLHAGADLTRNSLDALTLAAFDPNDSVDLVGAAYFWLASEASEQRWLLRASDWTVGGVAVPDHHVRLTAGAFSDAEAVLEAPENWTGRLGVVVDGRLLDPSGLAQGWVAAFDQAHHPVIRESGAVRIPLNPLLCLRP